MIFENFNSQLSDVRCQSVFFKRSLTWIIISFRRFVEASGIVSPLDGFTKAAPRKVDQGKTVYETVIFEYYVKV